MAAATHMNNLHDFAVDVEAHMAIMSAILIAHAVRRNEACRLVTTDDELIRIAAVRVKRRTPR